MLSSAQKCQGPGRPWVAKLAATLSATPTPQEFLSALLQGGGFFFPPLGFKHRNQHLEQGRHQPRIRMSEFLSNINASFHICFSFGMPSLREDAVRKFGEPECDNKVIRPELFGRREVPLVEHFSSIEFAIRHIRAR